MKLAAVLVLLVLCGASLFAGDAVPTPTPKIQSGRERGYATGDWGGLRTTLADRGVVFNLTYAADPIGVVSGGIKRGVLYNGFLDLGTDIDLEKLVGWKGGHFHLNAIYPHGENGSANYVGDIGTFSNIEAYDTYRLYELWVEQNFFEDRFSIRVGQITFDSEFAVLDAYGGLFVQSGFGAPEAFSANLPLPVYPNAAPGIRLRIEPIKGFAIQAAVFDGNVAPGLVPDASPNAAASTGSIGTARTGRCDPPKVRCWSLRSATASMNRRRRNPPRRAPMPMTGRSARPPHRSGRSAASRPATKPASSITPTDSQTSLTLHSRTWAPRSRRPKRAIAAPTTRST